jgi:tetratricopeptide (TPR) repeat protein
VTSMYTDEEKIQTRRRQADTAIQLALGNRWEEAAAANRAILGLFPNDTDAHNRLGMELGRYNDAKKAYRKALELDPMNQIAKKNLERLATLAKAGGTQETSQIDPSLFIEEMGKSTVTTLNDVSPQALAKLNAGDKLELKREKDRLSVVTPGGEFVGTVEPKLRARLIRLLDGGNKYAAAVTTLDNNECRVIIKETYRDPSQANRPSFVTTGATSATRPYTKESLLRHEAAAEATERVEDEEEDSDEEPRENWSNESVIQEGHVRLNDAAAAEEAIDEELEE